MTRASRQIDQIISAAFSSKPSYIFTTSDLVELAFPGIKTHTRAQRAAVLRAAKRVGAGMAWESSRPESRKTDSIWHNTVDPRSVGLANLRWAFFNQEHTTAELNRRFDRDEAKNIAPGGVFWERAELKKAELAGDTRRAAVLRKKQKERRKDLQRLIKQARKFMRSHGSD